MKTVVMLGGLGSQMFKYAFYLHLQEKSDEKCYISTVPYSLKKMWNGYELERIFNLNVEKIEDSFTDSQKNNYYRNEIGYIDILFRMMNYIEPNKTMCRINRGCMDYGTERNIKQKIHQKVQNTYIKLKKIEEYVDEYIPFYWKIKGNVIYDEFNHTSDKYIKLQKEKLKNVFRFPAFDTQLNEQVSQEMLSVESVAVHVRRGDHMYDNKALFDREYFKRAITYVKNKVKCPVFYIFSDDFEWCRNNLKELGLSESDSLCYVNWNEEKESFRDMQLMTYCKHNILCISSFSWWGYYLSKHTDKIVCAPKEYWFEVNKHF